MSEAKLKASILKALKDIGVMCFSNAQVGRRWHGGLGKGSSDVVGIVPCSGVGRWLAIEVKLPNGVRSEAQEEWTAEINRRGGYAVFVTTVEEALVAAIAAGRGEKA